MNNLCIFLNVPSVHVLNAASWLSLKILIFFIFIILEILHGDWKSLKMSW